MLSSVTTRVTKDAKLISSRTRAIELGIPMMCCLLSFLEFLTEEEEVGSHGRVSRACVGEEAPRSRVNAAS